ncbi:hypothetical protein [Bradyrhizobium denitrificans]|jgi:hypothetical protein|uniref:hypothetical protein n=1 Tax=Bradyrhizobium denitrificans TaxID=2734912 RepID=UPI001555758E|nr:hypothetical protein [Bradyrhizobium sp. LMG 8443]NPU23916.1 hypothetical protein [Bradyrhizobium sp. LMG 8443]
MAPHLVIVGADKGGVGKTTVARALRDYFTSHGISVRAFDGEYLAKDPKTGKRGTFARFFDGVEVVNLAESDDQMKVFDGLHLAQVTLLDLPAGTMSLTLKDLRTLGFFDGVAGGTLRLSAIHVIGSNKASFDEIDGIRDGVAGAGYHTVLNATNRSKFEGLPESVKDPIRVPLLEERTAADVDMQSVGFSAYYADLQNGMVKRGYVNSWLKPVFAEFDRKALNAL